MDKNRVSKIISGGILNLRPIDWESITDDAQNIVRWSNDREVKNTLRYFSFFQNKVTLGRQRQYFTRMIKSDTDRVFVIETELGDFLGTCGLHDIDPVNENLRIGIIIFNKNFSCEKSCFVACNKNHIYIKFFN